MKENIAKLYREIANLRCVIAHMSKWQALPSLEDTELEGYEDETEKLEDRATELEKEK